jgi:hypothetical protein
MGQSCIDNPENGLYNRQLSAAMSGLPNGVIGSTTDSDSVSLGSSPSSAASDPIV